MSDSQFKVTDRRMFTADGELKKEYRFLDEERGGGESAPPAQEAAREVPQRQPSAVGSPAPVLEPEPEGADSGPAFLDLVGMLAEPVPYYLGEAPLPNGAVRENLQMARVHIDLLDVLRKKTAGNLTPEEASVLEDVLYQLRMRYVQKRG